MDAGRLVGAPAQVHAGSLLPWHPLGFSTSSPNVHGAGRVRVRCPAGLGRDPFRHRLLPRLVPCRVCAKERTLGARSSPHPARAIRGRPHREELTRRNTAKGTFHRAPQWTGQSTAPPDIAPRHDRTGGIRAAACTTPRLAGQCLRPISPGPSQPSRERPVPWVICATTGSHFRGPPSGKAPARTPCGAGWPRGWSRTGPAGGRLSRPTTCPASSPS